MDTRDVADRAHGLIDQASAARAGDDGAACITHLAAAQAVLLPAGEDPGLQPVLHKVSWRLAKAGHDFDRLDVMLDALDPLLDEARPALGTPFDHVRSARRALSPIARRWWDARGYGDDRIARLWLAWAETYRDEGDPWLEASGHAQRAWHLACAGDQDALDTIIERYLATDPKRFGSGPHRHPRASDTPSSVWWAQLELVRIGLWASAWTGRRRRAQDLLDALEDAAEAAALDRADEPWFLDPACRAALAFGLEDVLAAYAEPWLAALDRLEHPRAAFHRALAAGLVAGHRGHPEQAIEALQRAVRLADDGKFGAEWQIDARRNLVAMLEVRSDPEAAVRREEAAELGTRFGIGWALAQDVTRA